MKKSFFDEIKVSQIERQVEDVYNKGIVMYFPNVNIEYPFGCDGFVDTKIDGKLLRLIIEYKFDELFQNATARAKVLIQILYYLKLFENNGQILPNVCLVGDINECFVFHTNEILPFLDRDLDWSTPPSQAYLHNPDLLTELVDNDPVNPYVFEVNEQFSFKKVADRIKELVLDVQRYVRITEHNLSTIFDYFSRNVIKNSDKLDSKDIVSYFIGIINDCESYYKHPTKKNTLVAKDKHVAINESAFTAFFKYFQKTYTPQEKNKFTEIADRLISDLERRRSGDFWTPTPFVDYAHKMLSEQFGADWKEKYVVYDNCCGSCNLTRDYKFKELYCSTLFQSELDLATRYNPEATKFQFDWLNDDLEDLPKGLRYSFELNKPIIFLLNPPYATSAAGGANTEHKTGVADTAINQIMKRDNIGASSQNLYAQFLYRILLLKKQYNLTDVNIGLFSPTLYLTGSSWKGFRSAFLKEFSFMNGCRFQASHFADVSDNWGIAFSVWNSGESKDKENFKHSIIDNVEGEIQEIDSKIIYNVDYGYLASDWVREEVKNLKTFDAPQLSSGIKIKDNGKTLSGRMCDKSMGYLVSMANGVYENAQGVTLQTSCSSRGHGLSIIPDNFTKCMALFSVRRLIVGNWKNDTDEYLKPNTEHPNYKEFENDSIVYSLFNTKSNQSSLRNIEYKGKQWDIINNFFWMDRLTIKVLANNHNIDIAYNQCNVDENRYVFNLLQNINLSREAKAVLDKADDLVIKTFPYRKLFNSEHPEYQVLNWDCGWYQIKAVCKEYKANELKEFNEMYKALADKMKPMVYELGFLK